MIRVLIADDHRDFRECLKELLAHIPGVSVIAEAADGREAVTLAQRESPDVILLDINMPVLNGIEATRQIAALVPNSRIVALTMDADRETAKSMLQAGAIGFVLKENAFDEVGPAVRAASAGRQYIGLGVDGGQMG